MALETYDRLHGLELADLAVDCCITNAPCGGEKAGKSPVDRGKRGIKRSRRVKRATISTTTRCGCLTGAEAATSSGVLLPSTRAFGHVPLTSEVDKSTGMERAPVAQEEDTNEQFADQQPRCEIGKTLPAEGECQRLGEVQVYGSLLCMAHAELLRLGQRFETLLGEVFQMDQWLESADGQVDELRIRRAEHHRNELVEQLRFNRTRINLIRDELSKDKDRTT
jgi:hypothetical protein